MFHRFVYKDEYDEETLDAAREAGIGFVTGELEYPPMPELPPPSDEDSFGLDDSRSDEDSFSLDESRSDEDCFSINDSSSDEEMDDSDDEEASRAAQSADAAFGLPKVDAFADDIPGNIPVVSTDEEMGDAESDCDMVVDTALRAIGKCDPIEDDEEDVCSWFAAWTDAVFELHEKMEAAKSSLPPVTTDEEMTDTDSDAVTFVDSSTGSTADNDVADIADDVLYENETVEIGPDTTREAVVDLPTPELEDDVCGSNGDDDGCQSFKDCRVAKIFGDKIYLGTITGCDDDQDNEGEKLYQVVYEDGDEEDLTVSELHAAIELYEKEENIGTFLEEQVAVLASEDPPVPQDPAPIANNDQEMRDNSSRDEDDGWDCGCCTLRNPVANARCEACGTFRPDRRGRNE